MRIAYLINIPSSNLFDFWLTNSSSAYGLASGIFTTDVNKIMKVSSELQAGTVWVNCYDLVHNSAPFGGFKRKLYV